MVILWLSLRDRADYDLIIPIQQRGGPSSRSLEELDLYRHSGSGSCWPVYRDLPSNVVYLPYNVVIGRIGAKESEEGGFAEEKEE